MNIAKMKKASRLFLGRKDFGKFCYAEKNGICEVEKIEIKKSGEEVVFNITADRFLYKMVRRLVGALVDVGRGKISEDDIKNALRGLSHKPFMTAPAKGLTLIGAKID